MKSLLRILPIILLTFISISYFFKMMFWPGSTLMLLIGIQLSAIIYFPLFFIQRILDDKKTLNIVSNILGFLTLFFIVEGVLFKILHWPLASTFLGLGIILILPFMILFSLNVRKNKVGYVELMKLYLVVFLGGLFLINLSKQYSLPTLMSATSSAQFSANRNLCLRQSNHEKYTYIKKVSGELLEFEKVKEESLTFIEDLRIQILMHSGESNEAINNPSYIGAKDQYDVPTHIMLYEGKGKELYERLIKFKQQVYKYMNTHSFNNSVFNKLELTSTFDLAENYYSFTWEEQLFHGTPLVMVNNTLYEFENKILEVESVFLDENLNIDKNNY